MKNHNNLIELTFENKDELIAYLRQSIANLKIKNILDKKEKIIFNEHQNLLNKIETNSSYLKEFNGKKVTINATQKQQVSPKLLRAFNKDNKVNDKKLTKKNKNILPIDQLVHDDNEHVIARIIDLELGFVSQTNSNVINKVIRGTSLHVKAGEILALIGESGSGKTVISSTLYGLTGHNSRIMRGKIKLYDQEVQDFSQKDWEKSKYRGKIVSGVFQNPQITLNPTQKIKYQMIEGILINNPGTKKKAALKIARDFLVKTRIHDVDLVLNSYPHELSGGMKQRVVIASVIACGPKLIIMDEPTTALDPSVQAEIIEIVRNLAIQLNIGVVFITHDLGVVASIADRIAIMYSGQIIEEGTASDVLYNPHHPYTWGLLQSMPDLNKGQRLKTIRGSVPTNLNNIVADAFAPRNDFATGMDFLEEAPLFNISDTHKVKSWLYDKRTEKFDFPQEIAQRMKQFRHIKVQEQTLKKRSKAQKPKQKGVTDASKRY